MSIPSILRKQVLTVWLVAFSSLLQSALASTSPTPRQYCVWACNEATSYVTFEGSEELDYYTNLCASDLFLESFSYCMQSYCTEEERTSGLKLQDNVCVTNAGIHLPSLDGYKLPSSELAAIDEVDENLILESAETPLDHAVLVSRDWYETACRTTAAHFKNRRLAYDFV
jgi:carboxypeptidase C (cathepsin A)